MLDDNPLFLGPFHQLAADVFGAIVGPYGSWLAAPFDDPVKAPDHALGGQGKVDLDAQPFAVEIVQHVQEPVLTAITHPIRHEVHRSGHVRCIWHRQGVRFVTLQPLARLDPQVQVQFAIDLVDAFVVPWMTLHVAQVQKT